MNSTKPPATTADSASRTEAPERGETTPTPTVPLGATTASLPAFLTVDEAAEVLRVSNKALYEAIKSESVPFAVRVGRLIRISRDGLLAWGCGKGSPALEESK